MSGSRVLVRLSFSFTLLLAIIQIAGCRGVTDATNTVTEASAASAPKITFTATPDTISAGSAATLSWNVTGAVTVAIDGVGTVKSVGSTQVTPATTTTYTLHAAGAGGQAQATATVSVGQSADFTFTANPSAITPGASTTLSWVAANETSVTIDNGVG